MTRAISWEEERYYVVTDDFCLFLYTDGDFTLSDSPREVYGFVNINEAVRALTYCVGRYNSGYIVRARLILEHTSTVERKEIDNEIRKAALAKLSEAEKQALGVVE